MDCSNTRVKSKSERHPDTAGPKAASADGRHGDEFIMSVEEWGCEKNLGNVDGDFITVLAPGKGTYNKGYWWGVLLIGSW